MRTILITLALLAMSIVGKAQSIDTILEQFKNEKNVTLVDMPKDLIALAASSSGDKDAAKYLKSIDRLRVLWKKPIKLCVIISLQPLKNLN